MRKKRKSGKSIEVDQFYDWLDNEDEADIISLTFTTNDKRISNAYGLILEAVSYTAAVVNEKINSGGLPQFFELVDDQFLEKHIKYVLDNNIVAN
ncbi:MAG TPA: Imm6 family immunity protein [Bacillota bacterium]|nr:Imm6 family immunity protein [Bacillota bacterium]HOL09764.1 Imm6 family immunity protein [Bacillota bacterium]HPO98556.1 Imm6 family immunity protein [Bacillota bacterium]